MITDPRPRLSPRQAVMLDILRSFIREHGYPPTVREIGARMDGISTNGVLDHLVRLETKGYIRRETSKSRAIILVPGPEETDVQAAAVTGEDVPIVKIPVFTRLDPPEVAATVPRPSCLTTAVWALVIAGDALSSSGVLSGDWLFVAEPSRAAVVAPGQLVVVRLPDVTLVRHAFPEPELIRLATRAPKAAPTFLRVADFKAALCGVACGLWRGAAARSAAERAA